jgi:hypothetical protein
MNYVEWLRVRNCLRMLAIVLGVLLVCGAIVRVYVGTQVGNDEAFVRRVMKDPATKISYSVVNGMNRTTIVNPHDHVTITVDDRPDGGRSIRITEPRKRYGRSDNDNTVIGSVSINESENGPIHTTAINTNAPVPLPYYFAIAGLVGLIVATIFGSTLARENDGHLEIALLKPVSRLRYSLGVIGVDLVGIVAAQTMTVVALIIGQSMYEVPHFDVQGTSLLFLLIVLLHPFAWYAMLNAATASLKRGAGAIIGFSWPVTFLVVILTHIPLGDSVLGQTLHSIFWTVSRIFPVSYASVTFSGKDSVISGNPWAYTPQISMLAILALVYGVLTVVQWRRVEA